MYSALFVPHITYGIEIWYGALQANRDRIFKLQKKQFELSIAYLIMNIRMSTLNP